MQDCLDILNIENETVFKGAFTNIKNIWSGGMTNIETEIDIISNPKRHPINFETKKNWIGAIHTRYRALAVKDVWFGLVCWSLTSLCHSNGHIETMPAREINPFTALTRIRPQFLRTQ